MSLIDSVTVTCPWCGEQNELVIDCSVPLQEYIEDCFVCCRPMRIRVEVDVELVPAVTVERGD
jgi:hypothetical protein